MSNTKSFDLANHPAFCTITFIIVLSVMALGGFFSIKQEFERINVESEKNLATLAEKNCKPIETIKANGLGAIDMVRFKCSDDTYMSISSYDFKRSTWSKK